MFRKLDTKGGYLKSPYSKTMCGKPLLYYFVQNILWLDVSMKKMQ